MGHGWIKLHRCLLDKPIWKESTAEQKAILIALLLMVDREEHEQLFGADLITVKPGQKVTSTEKILEACGNGVTRQNLRTALKKFEKLGFLTIKSTAKGTLVSVENWGLYQYDSDKLTNNLTNNQPTANQQLTNNLTTNKNIENIRTKELKNNNPPISPQRGVFVPPTIEEVREFCLDRMNGIDAEEFVDFYQSKGWMVGKNKMKDWKASVRTWERNKKASVRPQERKGEKERVRFIDLV